MRLCPSQEEGGAGERGKGPQRTEHGFLIYDLFFHRCSLFFLRKKREVIRFGTPFGRCCRSSSLASRVVPPLGGLRIKPQTEYNIKT